MFLENIEKNMSKNIFLKFFIIFIFYVWLVNRILKKIIYN